MTSPPNLDNDQVENQVRALVVEGLIQRHLLLQDAKRLQITVSDAAVTRHLAKGLARVSLPADQEDYAYYVGLQGPPDGPAPASLFQYRSLRGRVVREEPRGNVGVGEGGVVQHGADRT